MDLSTPAHARTATSPTLRLVGPDVVRALALIGVVVMNYHGYLIIRGGQYGSGWAGRFFDPWSGPLSTRFAATFVLVAGVGVTLLTRRSLGDPERVAGMRRRLLRRGALLYVGGLFLENIWNGTIIPYYGAMFMISALLFTLRARWIAALGVGAVAAGAVVEIWVYRRFESGRAPLWLVDPTGHAPQNYLYDVFVNGTHPLFPWLGFFCAGILLGRVLDTTWWRGTALGAGLMLASAAVVVRSSGDTDFERHVLSSNPFDRGAVYVASALGTALVSFAAVDWLARRFPVPFDPFRRAGQMTLTLYLAHIFVFNFVVDWMGWVEPGGLATSLTFALAFWVVGITVATLWHRRFGRGPAERFYRFVGG